MIKLAVIIPIVDNFPITDRAIRFLTENRDNENDYEIIVIDNGSSGSYQSPVEGVRVYRYPAPIGIYKAYYEALQLTDADVLAYIHGDFFIYEKGWDKRVMSEFERDPRLGLIGSIGSNEIDRLGGRGGGTMSNWIERTDGIDYEGQHYEWKGSAAEGHGKRITDFRYAAVNDGCCSIIRRKALEDIEYKENFPVFHFYEKLICTQLLEKGWKIGILGFESSHISGQFANGNPSVDKSFKDWATSHQIHPGGIGTSWNDVVYVEAEKQWLTEYRDQKHFIPLRVDNNGNIVK